MIIKERLREIEARFDREAQEYLSSHPKLRRAGRWCTQHRAVILAGLALIQGSILWALLTYPRDVALFTRAGRDLLSGNWTGIYADPEIQVGPLQLLYHGAVGGLADVLHLPLGLVLGSVTTLTTTFGSVALIRLLKRGDPSSPGLELVTGLIVLFGGLALIGFSSGHPSEAWVALGWIGATHQVRRGRWAWAGALIGLSAGLKLWGILGIALLLSARSRSGSVRAVVLALAIGGSLYAPFVLWGEFRSFEYVWTVLPQAPIRLVIPVGQSFPYGLRLIQGAIVLGAGAWFATRLRGVATMSWLLPLNLIVIRLLFDPREHHYYWLAAAAVVMVGMLTAAREYPLLGISGAAASVYVLIVPFYLLEEGWLALWIGTIAGITLAHSLFLARADVDSPKRPLNRPERPERGAE